MILWQNYITNINIITMLPSLCTYIVHIIIVILADSFWLLLTEL